jgi:hypothetical protein
MRTSQERPRPDNNLPMSFARAMGTFSITRGVSSARKALYVVVEAYSTSTPIVCGYLYSALSAQG